jgi:Transglutaminase-like superfamily
MQVNEMGERAQAPQEVPKQSKLWWGLTVARLLLRNPGALKKLMVMGPDEPRYVRPPREYELPEYREDMRRCTSNEKYLRPTRWCNPREPLVIAMANELGAHELSDWEFAEAAYWFVKTNVASEILPLDAASATLRRGTGTCYHLTTLWIALCRAAGIKARYKEFKTMLNDAVMRLDVAEMMDLTETERALIPNLLNTGISVMEGEACIDGKWVVGDAGEKPELYAQYGAPILKFGEDAVDLVFSTPGTMRHFESLPLVLGITMKAPRWFVPVVIERANVVHSAPLGKKIIEAAGGLQAYDKRARKNRGLSSLIIEPKDDTALIFAD